jgi:peptidoglycan hydrolase-like amidase
MMKLDGNGNSLGVPCYQGDDATTGCVEYGSDFTYPPSDPYITFANSGFVNPLSVDIEHYYLKNVIPREMDVVTNDPPLAALKAQALAARSIADWKAIKRNPNDDFKSITAVRHVSADDTSEKITAR